MKANELFIPSSGSVAFWEKDQLKLVGETGGREIDGERTATLRLAATLKWWEREAHPFVIRESGWTTTSDSLAGDRVNPVLAP